MSAIHVILIADKQSSRGAKTTLYPKHVLPQVLGLSFVGMSWVDADPASPEIPRLRRVACMSYRVWKETRHSVSIIRKEK